MKKLITLLGLLAVSCTGAMASHFATAEIRYEYTGNANDYKIKLTLLKACEYGSVDLGPQEYVNVLSSCSSLGNITLNSSYEDTISTLCPGYLNSCQTFGSTYFGFSRRVYEGVVSLPPCNDWKITWNSCCRNAGVMNLMNPSTYGIYVEATIDNSTSMNTNAWFPNPSPLVVTTGTTSYLPMQIVDAENDSLDIQWVQPMDAGPINVPYNTGYNLSAPFGAGGTATIDMANNQIIANAPMMGKYVLALQITEYRNGAVVGKTMRDFTIASVSGTQPNTIPMPAAGTSFNYVTCPGQANTISINFEDSTATDSVFLTVTPPVIPGFTFTTATTSAAGSANATISWTTPSSLNPATLPQFYINVAAKDNACPLFGYANYAIAVQTAQCNTDSVWAGDANADYTVNIYDPLAIAIAYGETGYVRVGATTIWQAEFCSPWANSFLNWVNIKHADCNGDGVVDNLDLPAVTANWGQTHMKGAQQAKTTGVPSLYFDVNGIQFIPGTTVSVPIMLGDAASIVNDFYGLGTTVSINGITPANQPTITYPTNSWLGNAANTLRFENVPVGSTNDINWAYAKIDHQNISNVFGQLAVLTFDIPSSTLLGTEIGLSFNNAHFIDHNGVDMTGYSTVDTTVITPTLSIINPDAAVISSQVIPNPSGADASLLVNFANNTAVTIQVTDAIGKLIWQQAIAGKKGAQQLALPAVANGMYFVRTVTDGNTKATKWIRN